MNRQSQKVCLPSNPPTVRVGPNTSGRRRTYRVPVSDIEPWALYSQTRDRMITMMRSLTDEQTGRVVPLTPGWTVADVLAHVCGLNGDVATGLREGLGTDERTARQVSSRAGMTVAEVCDEWLGHAEAMRSAIDEDGFFGRRLSADLVVHLHDVQHALGLAIDGDDAATVSGAHTYAVRTPDRWGDVAGVEVVINLSDGSRFEPGRGSSNQTSPRLALTTTPYDFLRSVTARRSTAEVRALDWSGDPGPLLDHFSPYGPLRSADAGV